MRCGDSVFPTPLTITTTVNFYNPTHCPDFILMNFYFTELFCGGYAGKKFSWTFDAAAFAHRLNFFIWKLDGELPSKIIYFSTMGTEWRQMRSLRGRFQLESPSATWGRRRVRKRNYFEKICSRTGNKFSLTIFCNCFGCSKIFLLHSPPSWRCRK